MSFVSYFRPTTATKYYIHMSNFHSKLKIDILFIFPNYKRTKYASMRLY